MCCATHTLQKCTYSAHIFNESEKTRTAIFVMVGSKAPNYNKKFTKIQFLLSFSSTIIGKVLVAVTFFHFPCTKGPKNNELDNVRFCKQVRLMICGDTIQPVMGFRGFALVRVNPFLKCRNNQRTRSCFLL